MESIVESLKVFVEFFWTAWNFKVATIDNNDLTIANIIIALIIFVIGFKISRKLSKFLAGAISPIHNISENTLFTIESVMFYFLLIIFTFTSLSIAQIPLSSFAVVGGALAIGFGFGSQNIIKNFISGIILMAEQPIRVGDIISVEQTEGKILKIGARSTHIKTFDNVDILVPNSYLLENNVVNWTLSDQDIRTRINVGVAYGEDTKSVESLLKQAADENEMVMKNKPIMVFFTEFGDNSLNFELQFWCKMPRPSAKRLVESDIRHAIYKIFSEAGIVISFPQRDIHLDTSSPLEVKIT